MIDPGTYIMWKGKLAYVISRADMPSVTLQIVGGSDCPHCGGKIDDRFSVIPKSPLWEENAKPVPTI